MARRITLKDVIRETEVFSGRVIFAGVVIGVLALALVARLVYLQIVSYDHFQTLSHDNRVTIAPITPTRGLIYDRNGVVLAQNLPSFSLEITPERVGNLATTLEALGKLIRIEPIDLKRFEKLRKQISQFKTVPLRYRLSEEEVARFFVRRYQFPGVEIRAQLMRHYPLGTTAVHAIGYVARISEDEQRQLDDSNYRGTDQIGKVGVERWYEDDLHGVTGFKEVETNASGRVIRVLAQTPPVPGKNLHLNIDIRAQQAAEAALGKMRGAVVAMNPKTGEVYVLASTPGFDPNPFVLGIDSDEYSALSTSPDQPLFNRAIRGRYPPGSTIKPFMGLAGLEYDVMLPTKEISCNGGYNLKGDPHRYRDWRKHGHGIVNLRTAIRESCDVYFYDLALNLGIDRMAEFMTKLGLGNKTGIDIKGEVAGLVPSREWKMRARREAWYPGETLIAGIGQGFNLTTPIQLAAAAGTMGTFGQRVQPILARALQDPLTGDMEYFQPVKLASVPMVNRANWDQAIKGMIAVVNDPRGTAYRLSVGAKYTIAGKTGTAQVFGLRQDETYDKDKVDERLRDHALFISFAPAEDPRVALSIIVENGGSGGHSAAPIARAIFDQLLLVNPS
ncbi:MAG: penicillin-binding protein 2 [Pseudomonadota bacterium]